jgi:hypothetical protein
MPQDSNKFYAKDKMDVARNMSQVLDMSKTFIMDYIGDAQRFVIEKNIMPSDQADGGSVSQIVALKGDQFFRVYADGSTEPIKRDVYVDESIYNFLPDRFKTYKPNG